MSFHNRVSCVSLSVAIIRAVDILGKDGGGTETKENTIESFARFGTVSGRADPSRATGTTCPGRRLSATTSNNSGENMSTLAGTSIPGSTHKSADEERARRLHSSSSSSSHHVPMKIPDLRFEHSYLKGISKFVHTEHISDGDGEGHTEVVKVDWGNVAWITFRDQMFMPLLQGLVWCVK